MSGSVKATCCENFHRCALYRDLGVFFPPTKTQSPKSSRCVDFHGGSRANANSRSRKVVVNDGEPPFRALQTSECNELLDPARASCLILAQRQPGKLPCSDAARHAVLRRDIKDVGAGGGSVPTTQGPEPTSTPPVEILNVSWAEARSKIATWSMTLHIDVNWSSFQLAN